MKSLETNAKTIQNTPLSILLKVDQKPAGYLWLTRQLIFVFRRICNMKEKFFIQ